MQGGEARKTPEEKIFPMHEFGCLDPCDLRTIVGRVGAQKKILIKYASALPICFVKSWGSTRFGSQINGCDVVWIGPFVRNVCKEEWDQSRIDHDNATLCPSFR